MRISFRWLKELIDLPAEFGPREVADRLTLVGLEVEAIEDLGAGLKDVIVGQILTRQKHPRADNLSVCTVEIGAAEPLNIVCGASNCEEGRLVPVARVGVSLQGRAPLEAKELRGVVSQGMLCSAKELGLTGGDPGGLLILEGNHVPGTPLARALGLDDMVLVVGVTPNRPDALSHVGVARDLAASLAASPPVVPGGPVGHGSDPPTGETRRPITVTGSTPTTRVKMPPSTCAERGGPIDDATQVKIEDPVRCPRYLARVIEGVVVGPSPQWLQRRLEACGVRSINNVVDVTNLVMLERGHPLHAFDLDRLGLDRGRPTVVVRTARAGEKLVTLDGVDRQLHPEDLLICDPDRPIALAGVMGGRDTEVQPGTTRILLEAAYFQPASVRRTARRHGLHTEASHRFERGCDPNKTLEESINRCAQLMAELAGGQVRRGVAGSYPKPVEQLEVTLRPSRAAAMLGLTTKLVDEGLVARVLTALGLEVGGRDAGALRFRIPTYRPDLTQEVDLIEEIGRMLGLDRIPETLPRGTGKVPPYRVVNQLGQAQELTRAALLAAGFDEAVNLAFLAPREVEPFDEGGQRLPRLVLRNPLGEELSVMRNTMLPGLLKNLAHNQRHGERQVRLFELGNVFLGARPEGAKPRPETEDGPLGGDSFAVERFRVGLVMTGQREPHAFDVSQAEADFWDLKGVVEELLSRLGFNPSLWNGNVAFHALTGEEAPYLHPGMCAAVRLAPDGLGVGVMGVLHPQLTARLDLRGPVMVAELDLAALADRLPGSPRFKPIPRFPAVKRDVSMLLDEQVTADRVFAALHRTTASQQGLVEKAELFDIYRDPRKLPPGKMSMALSLTFRAADRTLTDEAVNELHCQVMNSLELDLKAEVRKA